MKTLTNVPEIPITEEWAWQTNIIVADDGSEQRIELCAYPKRTHNVSIEFAAATEVRAIIALLLQAGQVIQVPVFQYQTRLKADAAGGSSDIVFVAARTDLRDGDKAYVFDQAGGEVVTLDGLISTGSGLAAPLGRSYTRRASIAPVRAVYAANNATLNRRNPDTSASLQTIFAEVGFTIPFVTEWNTAELEMFRDLPVLPKNAMGTNFGDSYDGGFEIFDFGGLVELRKSWPNAELAFNRVYLCNRVLDADDWDYWRVFADYCRGSCNPFFVPTFRQDFGIHTAPAPTGTTLSFDGESYADDFFPHKAFKQIAIYTSAGVHYATVTAAAKVGGNTNVTFSPALPAGGGWAVDQAISLLLKVRIADDKITCLHSGLHTEVGITMRTVDE